MSFGGWGGGDLSSSDDSGDDEEQDERGDDVAEVAERAPTDEGENQDDGENEEVDWNDDERDVWEILGLPRPATTTATETAGSGTAPSVTA
jgi:hypothetical protein